ncbi:MAG: O-antigen ligase family protein, partial [Anaerovorax sp.]
LAPKIGESTNWFQMLPIAFFTALIILITRMYNYQRPMEQFFWSGSETSLSDFFSYYKSVAILICAVFVGVLLLYRIFTQSLYVKRSFVYIPMIVYALFVILSYAFSDYKDFALYGWNDRFEGTLVLLAYMVMLFFVINSVNSEKNVKWIIYPLAASSAVLSLLGISQAMDKDFFRTVIGQKLLVPNQMTESGISTWQMIDQAADKGEQFLNFTFVNKEIYQTVYNINYVSFYLTLLIPLFAMLFIRSIMKGKECPVWKKILWGALFALTIYNLIGSASSGGLMGMAVVVFIALIVLNKRLLQWWKPVVILLVLTLLIGGVTYERWMPEFSGAVNSALGRDVPAADVKTTDGAVTAEKAPLAMRLDSIETKSNDIIMGLNGEKVTFTTYPEDPTALKVTDEKGNKLHVVPTNINPIYRIDDDRFKTVTVRYAQDEAGGIYLVVGTNGDEWPFAITKEGTKYLNGLGKLINMHDVPAVGFENNQGFGSGRGYIWSRTIPMMKDTLLLGHGADTYCAYFPHEDYVGKYNSGTFSESINIVVDKPHNMYMGMIIGTGGISMLALLVLWFMYIVQSFILYFKRDYNNYCSYVGVGIFLGICGFLAAGLVNDSTVSVMPMFYGLLGTGIAINIMLKRNVVGIEKNPKKDPKKNIKKDAVKA